MSQIVQYSILGSHHGSLSKLRARRLAPLDCIRAPEKRFEEGGLVDNRPNADWAACKEVSGKNPPGDGPVVFLNVCGLSDEYSVLNPYRIANISQIQSRHALSLEKSVSSFTITVTLSPVTLKRLQRAPPLLLKASLTRPSAPYLLPACTCNPIPLQVQQSLSSHQLRRMQQAKECSNSLTRTPILPTNRQIHPWRFPIARLLPRQ